MRPIMLDSEKPKTAIKDKTVLDELKVATDAALPAVARRDATSIRGGLGAKLGFQTQTKPQSAPYRPIGMRVAEPELTVIIDATGSRENSWKIAQDAHVELLKSHAAQGLKVRLVVFSGERTIREYGPFNDTQKLVNDTKKISCASGYTQFVASLNKALDLTRPLPSGVVVISDSCEEEVSEIEGVARKYKSLGIKIFALQDKFPNSATASFNPFACEKALRAMASITGGAYGVLGNKDDLAAILQIISGYLLGQKETMSRLIATNPAARAIAAQLK